MAGEDLRVEDCGDLGEVVVVDSDEIMDAIIKATRWEELIPFIGDSNPLRVALIIRSSLVTPRILMVLLRHESEAVRVAAMERLEGMTTLRRKPKDDGTPDIDGEDKADAEEERVLGLISSAQDPHSFDFYFLGASELVHFAIGFSGLATEETYRMLLKSPYEGVVAFAQRKLAALEAEEARTRVMKALD